MNVRVHPLWGEPGSYPLLSTEGRMLWLLFAAPISRSTILRAKLMSCLPPLVLVAEVLSFVSSRMLGIDARLTAFGMLVSGLSALSVTSLSIGIGAILPDYRAESAAKASVSFGGLVCMTLAVIVAFLFVGWALYPTFALGHTHHPAHGYHLRPLLSTAGLVVTTLVAVWLPLRLGRRRPRSPRGHRVGARQSAMSAMVGAS